MQEGQDRNGTPDAASSRALRTPEEFLAALERLTVIEGEPTMEFERRRLEKAVRSAPFVICEGRVTAKGFRAKAVR